MKSISKPLARGKFLRVCVLSVCLIMCFATFSTPVLAHNSYTTYSYNDNGWVECPDAYVPEQMVDTNTIGMHYLRNTKIDTPQDLFCDIAGNLYIADQKNNRIIVLNPDYSFKLMLNSFVNEWGVPDALTQPKGVYADSKNIYVADTQKNRIVVFKIDGTFERVVGQPESDVFPENHVYTPVAVAVDAAGRIYVVSSTTFQGIIAMGPDGEFQGFLGAQKSVVSAFQIFWRNFQTPEQRAASIRNVSTEYNNITIDSEGFVYATTSSIEESAQQSALTSLDKNRRSEYGPVKRLNPQGSDVLRRSGSTSPGGELFAFMGMGNNMKGTSKIIDVALGPQGTWSIIDEKRQRVYTYDEDGKTLFIFGDEGTQFGCIQSIQSITYQGDKMLLLDKSSNSITVYKQTRYSDILINGAIKNHRDRQYDKAVEDWQDVLKRNNNLDLAYIGIGKSYHREGLYLDAMEQFEYAMDLDSYSNAFKEYRKMWIEENVIVIPIVLIIVVTGASLFMNNAAKVNKRDQIRQGRKLTYPSHMLYAFHIMFHPFDGFWDMKHEKRGSMLAATTYLVLTCLSFIYKALGEGYIINPAGYYSNFLGEAIGIIIPVTLFCIANWCLTTLFDGEGSIKDIYMVTCYSLPPVMIITVVSTLLTNIITLQELQLIEMLSGFGFIWLGLILFFGVMVIHDYSLGKNVVTTLGTIVGMGFIMFVALLFSSLLIKMVGFVNGIYLELSYRS